MNRPPNEFYGEEKFCNILAMLGIIWLFQMFLPRLLNHREIPSSPDILRVILGLRIQDFRPIYLCQIVCNPSEVSSTIWLFCCGQLRLHLSHNKYFLVVSTTLWLDSNSESINPHLCDFQIMHGLKHYTYHNTTNRCNYRPWIELLQSWDWLVGWVLWHNNHCRLFNAKSIFIHIKSSISNNSVLHKYLI